MPGETTRLKLPYPVDADAPNAPAQIKALDELVEKFLLRGGQLLQKQNTGEQAISTGAGTYQETADKLGKLKVLAGGLIFVHYEALWKESALDAGRAAIFIGANQLKAAVTAAAGGAPQNIGAAIPAGTAGKWTPLITDPATGLIGMYAGSGDQTTVTTGMASGVHQQPVGRAAGERFAFSVGNERGKADEAGRGGVLCIRGLAEGEYEIGVRLMIKEAGQTVTIKERRLTAWTRESAP